MRESHDAMTDEERAQRKQRNRELYRMRSQRQQSSTSVADVAPPLSSGHIDYVVDVMRDHVNHEVSRMFGDLSTFSFSVYSGSLALSSGDIGSSQPLPEVILDEDYIDVNPPDLNDDDHFPDEQPVAAMPPPVNRRRGRRRSPLQRFSHNCARNYVDSPEYEGYVLPSPTTCRHCSAKLFPYESSNLCCKNGKIVLPYQPPPDELFVGSLGIDGRALLLRGRTLEVGEIHLGKSRGDALQGEVVRLNKEEPKTSCVGKPSSRQSSARVTELVKDEVKQRVSMRSR